ncbi:MAG: hypothetical protein AAB974_02320, partial [Patescibacteria group bacterium]
MANGRTITKTRTQTTTRTATAVALGTVGMAAIAAAALGLNFREMNALTPQTGSIPRVVASAGGSTAPTAPIALGTGTAVNLPRPTVGAVPTPTAAVVPLSAASCRSNPKNFPDLTLGTGIVTRVGIGTTRGVVSIQILNNTDKRAEAFALKCIEQLANGRWQELSSYPQPFLEGRRQRTQSVEYSPPAVKVQCFVDAAD